MPLILPKVEQDRITDSVLVKNEGFKPSLSLRYPKLVPHILTYRKLQYRGRSLITRARYSTVILPSVQRFVVYRHTSPLRRKLGTVNELMVEGKIRNLKIAAQKLNGLLIQPGETFSLWSALGEPTTSKGYVDGLLLSAGKPEMGIGGGLCQLANLLTWAVMHSELLITKRHHHSVDAFPDSGRTVPFGTGATIFYPTLDLNFTNTSTKTFQLEVWLTETQLCCKLRCDESSEYKYHIYEKDNCFLSIGNAKYRHNKIYIQKLKNGEVVSDEFLYENTFPVLY
jgi:vancomycin resistance protein VanW